MSSTVQQEKAKQRRDKFAALLRDMFQLDQPELDFGLYRILHARKDDVNRFIEQDLPSIAQEAFKDFSSQDKNQLEQEIAKARQAASAAGFNPDESPKVKELEAQYQSGFDIAREEGEVYDALVTFFSRYYDEGDFISRRVYKDGTYAIPYQGEEVVLHWANKDQYYIKSSEALRDYTFRLKHQAHDGEDPQRVHFKLVDATAGAKDNNKETDEDKRQFVLDAEQPFELTDSDPDAQGKVHQELHCRFYFRPAIEADWVSSVKDKATAAAKKKAPTQTHLLDIAEVLLLGADSALPAQWKAALAERYRKTDGELADYSTLKGQLNNYTKKNTFDYFIHKDLDGFLTRELDFYIKNELMQWADFAALKANPARLAPMLSKLDVTRTLGKKIIAFLAQLENFQKKLWLKKKFVTETNYCITLDRVPEELYAAICENKAQLQEWIKLFAIDEIQGDLTKSVFSNPITVDFLKDNQNLVLDTCFFDNYFKGKLISSIENFDEQCCGLLIHSENFQAINLMSERYSGLVKCVYIDPPYNAPRSQIAYKNNYKHSSFLSLMQDRLIRHSSLLSVDGATVIAIDKHEENGVSRLVSSVFPENDNVLITVEHNRKGAQGAHFSYTNEYAVFSIPPELKSLNQTDREEEDYEYSNLRNWGGESLRTDAANCFYPVYVKNNEIIGFGEVWFDVDTHPDSANVKRADGVIEVFPIDRSGIERKWRYERGTVESIKHRLKVDQAQNGELQIKIAKISDQFKTVWYSPKYNAGDNGTQLAKHMGIPIGEFDYPKSIHTTKDCVYAVTPNDAIVFDYFAGSGTTGQAVITLNREIKGSNRKFVLVEMGAYFDRVTRSRLTRSVYASEWQNGKPVSRDTGISHCFKYIRLESYEDTLGNLRLERKLGQQSMFAQPSNDSARQAYVMSKRPAITPC